jgi:hypothetical protein
VPEVVWRVGYYFNEALLQVFSELSSRRGHLDGYLNAAQIEI